MFLSVIIPCYNVEENILKKCILSIINQDYTDYEVIVVDDGSDEKFKKIIVDIGQLDERITIITQENAGVSAARNKGVKSSKGRYIVFVDADDVLVPYFFSEAMCLCEKEKADFLIGGNTLLNNNRFNEEKQKKLPINYKLMTEEEKQNFKCNSVGELKYFGNMGGYFGRGPWTRLIKREIAETIVFNENLKMGEDIVWNLELLDKCQKVLLVERIWYLYYVNNNSANHKYNAQMLANIEKELPCIAARLDLDNEQMNSAFCVHILDELKKVYDCYIGNEKCTLSKNEIKLIKKKLYSGEPWIMAGKIENRKHMNRRNKIKSMLYKNKIYFETIYIKKCVNAIKRKGH